MEKKVVTPTNESTDLEVKLQKEVARLEKKVLSMENDLLKSKNKYLKLEQRYLALQAKSNKTELADFMPVKLEDYM